MPRTIQIPLVNAVSGDNWAVTDYLITNGSIEVSEKGLETDTTKRSPTVAIIRRPGVHQLNDTGYPNYGRGIYNWYSGQGCYSSIGNRIYKTDYTGTTAEITTAPTRYTNGTTETDHQCRTHFAEFSVGANVYLMAQLTKNYTPGSTATSETRAITTAGAVTTPATIPTNLVPGIVNLDGYCFVMDRDKKIYNSDLNNPTTGYSTYISSTKGSDKGVGIAKYQNYVVAFNEHTIEFFYDAGNAVGSPLTAVEGASFPIGCGAGNTICEIQNSLMFVARDQKGSLFVAVLDGLEIKKVSVPFIDKVLNNPTTNLTQEFYAFTAASAGQSYYILAYDTANGNGVYVFNLNSKQWSYWNGPNAAPFLVSGLCEYGYNLGTGNAELLGVGANTGTSSGGIIYTVNPYRQSDDTGGTFYTIPLRFVLANLTFGVDTNKFIRKLIVKFNNDLVYGMTFLLDLYDKGTIGQPTVCHSSISLTSANTTNLLTFNNCGRIKDGLLSLEISESSIGSPGPTPLRILGIEAVVDGGSYGT